MKFTKLTLVAMLLALLVCAFAACGGDTQTDAGTDADSGNETEATPGTDNNETEHEHTIVEKIEEPTCQTRGYKREVCSVCEQQISVKPIDMIDHVAAAPATCTEASVCKFCGTTLEAATGHTLGTITDSKPATKTEEGYEKGTCTVCGVEITNVLPAGITDNFNALPAGVLTADIMSANSTLASDFTFSVSADAFEVVTENGNSYIKKPGANGQLKFTGEMLNNASKLEITFDFRLDQECNDIKGLLSIMNGGKEMRILNVQSGSVWFGINKDGVVEVSSLELGEWVKIKVVLDTTTYDYEIYVNGEKALYTTADPDNEGMHLVYTLQDGAFAVAAPASNGALHNGADRSPFVPNGEKITQFYFYHFSADLACSLDNLTVGVTE